MATPPVDEALERGMARSELTALLRKQQRARRGSEASFADELRELGCRLRQRGRAEEALQANREAVEILRGLVGLAEPRPKAPSSLLDRLLSSRPIEPPRATLLVYLRDALQDLRSASVARGLDEETIDVDRQLVDVCRQLVDERPDLGPQWLVDALGNLGHELWERGAKEDAISMLEEAIDVQRQLAEPRPSRLVTLLCDLQLLLEALGQPQRAIVVAKEALELLRSTGDHDPLQLDGLLGNLVSHLRVTGRLEEALEHAELSVDALRGPARLDASRYLARLARRLANLGFILYELERHGEASQSTFEAVELYREIHRADPEKLGGELATSLASLAAQLDAQERHEEAREVSRELESMLAERKGQ